MQDPIASGTSCLSQSCGCACLSAGLLQELQESGGGVGGADISSASTKCQVRAKHFHKCHLVPSRNNPLKRYYLHFTDEATEAQMEGQSSRRRPIRAVAASDLSLPCPQQHVALSTLLVLSLGSSSDFSRKPALVVPAHMVFLHEFPEFRALAGYSVCAEAL